MNWHLDVLKKILTADDKEMLDRIYEPRVVAVPPSEACNSLCVMPDGEIRCYGEIPLTDSPEGEREPVYISSRDCGLSWKEYAANPNAMGAFVRSPWSGRYFSVSVSKNGQNGKIRISDKDMDSSDFREVTLPGTVIDINRLVALEGIKRWILATERDGHAVLYISDDDGESWRAVDIPKTDRFEMKPPHKGLRWENSGVEPTLIELKNGKLMMILRTSTDYHYITYSDDYGDNWTRPEPTDFHSTLTNPFLMRLSDGKILFFYNNTKPLPELDKTKVFPPLWQDEIDGVWEDVFTNRDSNCIAVSSDEGETWQGFRELYLNPLRNNCDFRTLGGNGGGRDKSVHQFQAIELPNNKILAHVGQHSMVRKLLIFDFNWLYEKKRSENFRHGLDSVSTQVYLKSVTGCFRKYSGHCAWNRTNGAIPVPDPCGDHTEAVLIKNTEDDRLFSNAQGLVWNFPSAHEGVVTVRLKVNGLGLRISLMDHWQNPIDLTVKDDAIFTSVITKDQTLEKAWSDVAIRFNTLKCSAELFIDGEPIEELTSINKAPNGICYLHLQTVSDKGDFEGSLVKSLDFSGK